jgi:hypothetical protein
MAAFTATRAGIRTPSASNGWAQDIKRAWGTIEVTAAPVNGDTYTMLKLPKGAMIVGGYLQGDKLDSAGSGSACLTINIGLDAAVVTATGTTVTTSSTSNALASAWALGPDTVAVTGYKADTAVRNLPLGSLLLTDGPLFVTDEANVIVKATNTACGFTTGTLTLMVDYYISTHS